MSSNIAIRPTSLDGIKRLATSIKRQQKIAHSSALDQASILAGFENYRHALNSLAGGSSMAAASPLYRVYMTAYWRDREVGGSGRETLTISLPCTLGELIEPRYLPLYRSFRRFHFEGPDHLSAAEFVDSQSIARDSICAVARALQFMQATRLVPSKSHSRAYPGGDARKSIPGCDHYSVWYQRETKRFVFVDEPYTDGAHHRQDVERAEWARTFGQTITKPSWAGMYYPDGGSQIYLIADTTKGADVNALGAALDRLPPPIVEDDWDGESGPALPGFVSPGEKIVRDSAKSRAPQMPTGARKPIGTVQTLVGPQSKHSRMPADTHARVGELIKTVMAVSHSRKGVQSRLDLVRSVLDGWAQKEHPDLPSDQFFDLYYRKKTMIFPKTIPADERIRLVGNLNEVKQILTANYQEGRPLRSVISKVDLAIKSMMTWNR